MFKCLWINSATVKCFFNVGLPGQVFDLQIASLSFISQELPINIKFCFEGMEESGSEGLDELVLSRKDTFFKDVDYVCISDNYWLGKSKPCITYGLRGICYFFMEVMIERFKKRSFHSMKVAHWGRGTFVEHSHTGFVFFCFSYSKVECGCKDLHSGVFGGSVHEAMTDLITLMGK